ELITQELQQDFSQHQETYYFLKLEKASPEKFVSIAWIKTFTDIHEWSDFYWDTEYQRACVMIKFVKDRYEVLCQGFYWFGRFEVCPKQRPPSHAFEGTGNLEKWKMIPRELYEK